jgi:hypothetical protein
VLIGIVVGNRLFIGSKFGDHLVVSPGHLSNFSADGKSHVGDQEGRMRPAGALTGAMIGEFLAGSFYERMFAAMVPFGREVTVADRRLKYESFALDMMALARAFGIEINVKS